LRPLTTEPFCTIVADESPHVGSPVWTPANSRKSPLSNPADQKRWPTGVVGVVVVVLVLVLGVVLVVVKNVVIVGMVVVVATVVVVGVVVVVVPVVVVGVVVDVHAVVVPTVVVAVVVVVGVEIVDGGDGGVVDVVFGTEGAVIVGVGFEDATVEPFLFVATTTTRTVEPTSQLPGT
jgi:hypothetical protein